MSEKMIGKKKIIADAILVAALLLVSLSVFLIMSLVRDDGAVAVVTLNGEEIGRYSLSEDGVYELNGGTNILTVKDGEAYVSHADCKNQKCVNMGKKSKVGQFIACTPNGVVIVIEGESGDDEMLEV